MTLRELLQSGIEIEGSIEIREWKEEKRIVHYDGDIIPSELKRLEPIMDRKISYIFPYIYNMIGFKGSIQLAAICIELE